MKKISLPKIGIRPVIDGRRMGVRGVAGSANHEHGESHRQRLSARNCATPAAPGWSA